MTSLLSVPCRPNGEPFGTPVIGPQTAYKLNSALSDLRADLTHLMCEVCYELRGARADSTARL